jgi:hypothetical protein
MIERDKEVARLEAHPAIGRRTMLAALARRAAGATALGTQ